MALIKEDFIRCTECRYPEFKESERLTISKTVKSRASKTERLPAMERHIVYECANCGHELDR